MTRLLCGLRIRNGAMSEGTGGCLITFPDAPDRILLLTAGHAVLPQAAQQNDPIEAVSQPGKRIGTLRTWSGLDGATTVDAALIWIDPAMIGPNIEGLNAPPAGIVSPKPAMSVRLYPDDPKTGARTTTIAAVNQTIRMDIPAWQGSATYAGQIRTSKMLSLPGESGAMMFDTQGNIVGMVVGGSDTIGDIVTPIDAILSYPGWNGLPGLVTQLPANAVAPPAAIAPGVSAVPISLASLPPITGTSFPQLHDRYLALFALCTTRPEHAADVTKRLKRIAASRPQYDLVEKQTGAPWWYVGIVHAMECDSDFTKHLHNGDPLSRPTVQVPAGRPPNWNPPGDWVASAVDAITYQGYAGQSDWSLARTLYRLEGYNGYGYYSRDINSPYLWSFSNLYTQGKFVADHKFDPTAVSSQCGAAVTLKAMAVAGDAPF